MRSIYLFPFLLKCHILKDTSSENVYTTHFQTFTKKIVVEKHAISAEKSYIY